MPVLLRHLTSEMFSGNGLSFLNRFKIVLVTVFNFIYFVSPIDILPEAILGLFGYIDDLILVVSTLVYLSTFYRHILETRARV